MRKVLIACFLVSLMLLLPITSSVGTVNITTTDTEMPQFYITDQGRVIINNFIDANFEGESWEIAHTIADDIIAEDLEVDIVTLADYIQEYSPEPIPEEELQAVTSIEELNLLLEEYWNIIDGEFIRDLFGQLIDKIIELIKDRLGWIYEFLDRSITLITDGVELVYDYIQPTILLISLLIVEVVNQILSIPNFISDLIKDLFAGEYNQFVDDIVTFTEDFAGDFSLLLQEIINFINNQQLKDYLTDIQNYVNWLGAKPWEDPIHVTGSVTLNAIALQGGTITCRGQTGTTDGNGQFSFYVDPNPSADSFPPNVYYGLHNCEITVSKNGEDLKQTPRLLSYCFSGGEITWPFFIIKGKSKEISLRSLILEKLNRLIEIIQSFLPNFCIT
jgi:hypothetical protein